MTTISSTSTLVPPAYATTSTVASLTTSSVGRSASTITATTSVSTFNLTTGVIISTYTGPLVITNASTTVSLAPLLTVHTGPESCTALPYTFLWSIDGTSTFYHDPKAAGAASCWPSGFSTQANQQYGQYSPGVCPSNSPAVAWIPANITSSNAARSFCCPPGRTLADNGACFTTITTPTTVVMKPPTQISISTPFVAVDWAVIVNWAYSDLNRFVPVSAPALTTRGDIIRIQNTTSSSITTTPSETTSSTSAPSSGIAAGSIAGIVIGAVVVILIAVASGWFFARAKTRRDQSRADAPVHRAELESEPSRTVELSEKTKLNELATGHNVAEMHVEPAELQGREQ